MPAPQQPEGPSKVSLMVANTSVELTMSQTQQSRVLAGPGQLSLTGIGHGTTAGGLTVLLLALIVLCPRQVWVIGCSAHSSG